VLDIGCDDGFMQQKVAAVAKEVVGIDVNPSAVEANHAGKAFVMDATAMSFPSASFDKIFSAHTIEHIKNLRAVFREVDRVLKPGGLVFFIYPWELFRGMAHARGAWKMYHNPFLGYRFHVHRLNPKKVVQFAAETKLQHLRSEMVFMRTPQWTTLFEKRS
jgi:ubiquinone/menaquinone biosynthesis C-methylase UbiE